MTKKLNPLFKVFGIDVDVKGESLRALQIPNKTQATSNSQNISLRITSNSSDLRFEVDPELNDGDVISFLDEGYIVKQIRKVSIFRELYWDVSVELQQIQKRGSIYD